MTTYGDVAATLRRSIGWLVLSVVVCSLAGVVVARTAGVSFQSTGTLKVEQAPTAVEMLLGVPSQGGDRDRTVENYVKQASTASFFESVRANLGSTNEDIDSIRAALDIEAEKGSDIITVSAVASNPATARSIAEAASSALMSAAARRQANETRLLTDVRRRVQSGDQTLALPLMRMTLAAQSAPVERLQRPSKAVRVSPSPARAAWLGGIAGLVLMLLVLALAGALDKRVRRASQIRNVFTDPVVFSWPDSESVDPYAVSLELVGAVADQKLLVSPACLVVLDPDHQGASDDIVQAVAGSLRRLGHSVEALVVLDSRASAERQVLKPTREKDDQDQSAAAQVLAIDASGAKERIDFGLREGSWVVVGAGDLGASVLLQAGAHAVLPVVHLGSTTKEGLEMLASTCDEYPLMLGVVAAASRG